LRRAIPNRIVANVNCTEAVRLESTSGFTPSPLQAN
jgi:hypothetical protein